MSKVSWKYVEGWRGAEEGKGLNMHCGFCCVILVLAQYSIFHFDRSSMIVEKRCGGKVLITK